MSKGLCREHPGNWVKGPLGNLTLPLPDHSKACALLQHPIIDTLPLQIELFHGKASLIILFILIMYHNFSEYAIKETMQRR